MVARPPLTGFDPIPLPAHCHPVAAYLASHAPNSRHALRHTLELAARLLTGGHFTADVLPWHELRCQHVQALRTALLDAKRLDGTPHTPATANLALTMAPDLKTIIHQRQLYASSMIDGRTAGELEPRSTAGEEITALWQELSTHVRLAGACHDRHPGRRRAGEAVGEINVGGTPAAHATGPAESTAPQQSRDASRSGAEISRRGGRG
jgi:hypothetical protein